MSYVAKLIWGIGYVLLAAVQWAEFDC